MQASPSNGLSLKFTLEATQLLNARTSLLVPDLIFAEFGNILWKKCRTKELTLDVAHAIFNDFTKALLQSFTNETLAETAWGIAIKYQCTFYDSLYLALAQTENCLLITADRTLCNILQNTPLATSLLWVEDIKNIR